MRRTTPHPRPRKRWFARVSKFLKHWAVLATLALLVLFTAAACLWQFPTLRPYLVGFATALAAFLGPLPGLLSPETRGKWLFAVGVAAVVGLGAWYSSDQLEKERRHLEKEENQLNQRVSLQQEFFRVSVKNLSVGEQSSFLLSAAQRLGQLYPQPKVEPLLDVISVVNAIDQGNGHAYYFAGEEYRSLMDQTNMRGAFQHYLAAAVHHPEANDGDYKTCSQRTAGYCGERTALINHLLAHDYLHEAVKSRGDKQLEDLRTALRYERQGLQIWRFNRDGSLESSCELLQGVATQLRALGRSTNEVDAALEFYRSRYGGC